MSVPTDTDLIRQELTVLSSRLEAVERRLGQNGSGAGATIDLASAMADVRQITQEIFLAPCEFTSEFDPEYPEEQYVVVNVEATGDPKEIVDRSSQWHSRIRQLSADLAADLRLFVVPR
jgi:hypothetical protein